jgi:hypothetical protein
VLLLFKIGTTIIVAIQPLGYMPISLFREKGHSELLKLKNLHYSKFLLYGNIFDKINIDFFLLIDVNFSSLKKSLPSK